MQVALRKVRAFVCRYTKIDANAECYGLEIGEQELENMLFEIISKQARVVLNVDISGGDMRLDLLMEQEAGYKRQLADCADRKRGIYERYVLGEIDAENYKTLKADLDYEYKRLERSFAASSEQVSQIRISREADTKTRCYCSANKKTPEQNLKEFMKKTFIKI
jgi:hypothetical protein